MKTPADQGPHITRYDAVVCGGGSAGIGAALTAARGGANVLLVERSETLGGTAVRGGVGVWEPGVGGDGLPQEIFDRLARRPNAVGIYSLVRHVCFGDDFPGGELVLDPSRTYADTLRRHGTRGLVAEPQRCRDLWHGVVFDRDAYRDTILEMLAETGRCDVRTALSFDDVRLKGRHIVSARLDNGDTVSAPWWIDATGDAALAVSAGCRTRLGRESRAEFGEPGAPETASGTLNGATLVYEVERVADGSTPAVPPLPPDVPRDCWWRNRFPLASFCERPGSPTRRHGVNMLPTMDGAEAWRLGDKAAQAECRRRVLAHWHDVQTRYPEFRGFRLVWIAPMLGVRESRRIVARYTLTEHDLRAGLSGQNHDDIVAVADHAVDVHGAHGAGCGELAEPYGIPFRCLKPVDCDNLLVTGRAAGFSSIAASSCRLSRTMLQLGVAAGRAVCRSVTEDGPTSAVPAARRDPGPGSATANGAVRSPVTEDGPTSASRPAGRDPGPGSATANGAARSPVAEDGPASASLPAGYDPGPGSATIHHPRRNTIMRTRSLAAFTLVLVSAVIASADTLRFPPEAELVNVKDYGAVGDGVADDTAAINKAFVETIDVSRYRANRFVFLPKGTYKVTGPIEGRVGGKGTWSAGWRSMMLLMGESRDGTVIKLADHAPGYGDPAKPKWVIACGSEGDNRDNEAGGGNRAFRHSFVNFTVDVGAGNPGAIAIDFIASNRGTIEDVTLRAAPGSGHTGIAMTRHWPGPAFIGDVAIDGFDTALRLDHYQYGMTFENLVLRNQRGAGVRNTNNMLAMRKVDYVGNVPFYVAGGGHSFLSLLDSTLKADPPQPAAIQTGGFVNLRRVRFLGFALAVDDTSKANRDLAGMASIPEGSLAPSGKAGSVRPDGTAVSWDLGATFAPQGAPSPLDLPIEDAPKPRPGTGEAWTFGGTTRESLQAAIDSGAEWVFVRATLDLDQPLVLRGKLRLLMGLSAHLKGLGGKVAVRVEDGAAEAVVLEHIYLDGIIEQASGRTFALRHGDLGAFHGTGTGKSHVLDTIGKGYRIGPKHRFWGRQINSEFGDEPLFTNEGQSWLLGFKMESSTRGDKHGSQGTPCFLNRGGGQLEIFAGLLYTLGSRAEHRPAIPAFTNEKGAIAIAYRHNGIPATWYDQILRVGIGADAETIRNDRIGGPGRALLGDVR